MGKSVWYVLIMGVVGVTLLVVLMLATLQQFQESPAGNQTRIAEALRQEFSLTGVSAVFRTEGEAELLLIRYGSEKDLSADLPAAREEMGRVAERALQEVGEIRVPGDRRKGGRLRKVREVHLTRSHVSGSGCWQRTLTQDHVVPNAEFGKDETPGFPFRRR